MADRDRQHVKLSDDLVADDVGVMFSVAEFEDEDEQVPRDLAALGFTTVNMLLEQPDGTVISIPTSALDLAAGTYSFSSAAGNLIEGADQHVQIAKTGGGLIETTTFLTVDVVAKLT